MIITIIANIFIGTILALVGVYLLIYRKVAIYSNDGNKKHFNKGVSIIIAVKNELENLKQNLTLLLAQEYPDYPGMDSCIGLLPDTGCEGHWWI